MTRFAPILLLLAVGIARHASAQTPFQISGQRSRVVTTTLHQTQYEVKVGGTVDMDNTTTRIHGGIQLAFQPNISLEIANTGELPVINLRIVINDRGRWWNITTMLDEILADARDDQEKTLLIWNFVRNNRHHNSPLFIDDELHDPVRFLCVYGSGLCDDSAAVGCSTRYFLASLVTMVIFRTQSQRPQDSAVQVTSATK